MQKIIHFWWKLAEKSISKVDYFIIAFFHPYYNFAIVHRYCWRTLPKSTLRGLWSLWHVIRLMRRHDLTDKKTMTKTKTKIQRHLENTLKEWPRYFWPVSITVWDIWSEFWGDLTWPTKRQWQRQVQRHGQWQKHLENTLKERPTRLLTIEILYQSDEDTWHNLQKDNNKDDDSDNDI